MGVSESSTAELMKSLEGGGSGHLFSTSQVAFMAANADRREAGFGTNKLLTKAIASSLAPESCSVSVGNGASPEQNR